MTRPSVSYLDRMVQTWCDDHHGWIPAVFVAEAYLSARHCWQGQLCPGSRRLILSGNEVRGVPWLFGAIDSRPADHRRTG